MHNDTDYLGKPSGKETFDAEKYANQNPVMRLLLNNFVNNLVRLIDQTHAERILDAGCGEGHLLKYILEKRQNLNIEGFDYTPDLVERARQINPALKLSVGDIYNIACEADTYDAVLCPRCWNTWSIPKRLLRS